MDTFKEHIHARIRAEPLTVLKLQCLFIKLRSIMDIPLLRISQCNRFNPNHILVHSIQFDAPPMYLLSSWLSHDCHSQWCDSQILLSYHFLDNLNRNSLPDNMVMHLSLQSGSLFSVGILLIWAGILRARSSGDCAGMWYLHYSRSLVINMAMELSFLLQLICNQVIKMQSGV